MSGYRNLHRQQVLLAAVASSKSDENPSNETTLKATPSSSSSACPIWHVQTTSRLLSHQPSSLLQRGASSSPSWRIWTAAGDGLVRTYLVQEKSLDSKQDNDVLDASALQLTCTHVLLGEGQDSPANGVSSATTTTAAHTVLGCTRVSLVRNYVGEDENAGQMLVASMEMAGRIRIWQLDALDDDHVDKKDSPSNSSSPRSIKSTHEFVASQATGTTLLWCPPRLFGNGPVLLATACLDGTIAFIASGCSTPATANTTTTAASTSKKELVPGTVVATAGSSGTSLAMSLVFSPTDKMLVAGRQDGSVDMFQWSSTTNASNHNNNASKGTMDLSPPRLIRLLPHVMESPVRAVSFTTDGQLIMAGSDQGMICIWNLIGTTNSKHHQQPQNQHHHHHHHTPPPQLVHHVLQAHSSWILDLVAIDPRRFVSCGMDQQLHVWNVGQIYQPAHSFSSDHVAWTLSTIPLASSASSSMAGAASTSTNATPLSQQHEQFRLVTGSEQGWLQVYSLDGKV